MGVIMRFYCTAFTENVLMEFQASSLEMPYTETDSTIADSLAFTIM